MKRSTFFALIGILSFTLLLRALPLFQHVFWGMDEGEYLVMTGNIVQTGSISTDYSGWTVAYPYFQGFFILSATFSSLSSLSVLSSLGLVAIISILAPISAFLMASRIMGESSGIAASAFIAVAVPYAYHTSLPAPESLGAALLIVGLLMLWKGGKKSMLISLILSSAMIVSHPLSGYIFLLFAGASVLIRILNREKWREIWFFLLIYSTILLGYWMFAGKGFREGVLMASGVSPVYVVVLTYLTIIFLYFFGKSWKRKTFKGGFTLKRSFDVRFFLASLLVVFVILFSIFVKIPGLSVRIDPETVLFFSPYIILIFVSLYGISIMKISKRGIETWGWITVLTLSALAGYFLNAHLLIPYRHLEYMMIPFSIFFAGAVYIMLFRSIERNKIRGFLTVALVLLLVINAFTIYPPPQYSSNFSESTDWDEMPSVLAASHMKGNIVTDHRLSTVVFAMGNENVSWEEAGDFFRDPKNSTYNGDYILITDKMAEGAVFGSGKPAEKIERKAFLSMYILYSDPESTIYLLR